MDNRMSLEEYLSNFRTVAEKRAVFYAVFEEMHRYHNNGEYLTKINFQTISVCFTNPADIHFSHYQKIGNRPIQEVLNLKFQNIMWVSQMMISAFMEHDSTISPICREVITSEFSNLKKFLHPEDYVYFENVFLQKEFLYYDDYIRNQGKDKYIELTEKRSISPDEQAFTTYLLLTINLAVVSMIFACICMYLS